MRRIRSSLKTSHPQPNVAKYQATTTSHASSAVNSRYDLNPSDSPVSWVKNMKATDSDMEKAQKR